jgi:hypothetical protein
VEKRLGLVTVFFIPILGELFWQLFSCACGGSFVGRANRLGAQDIQEEMEVAMGMMGEITKETGWMGMDFLVLALLYWNFRFDHDLCRCYSDLQHDKLFIAQV